jgi:hypothetical protein
LESEASQTGKIGAQAITIAQIDGIAGKKAGQARIE